MDTERLDQSAQALYAMTVSLATVVVGAISLDKASAEVDLGDAARFLLSCSLAAFLATLVAGGHLISRLPLLEGTADEVLGARAPLMGKDDKGVLALTIGAWRAIQHWGLLIAILLGAAGGLATATAEDLAKAKAASAHAVASSAAAPAPAAAAGP